MATFNEVFEALRATAEADTANYAGTKRRPSWAPAIVLGPEILQALADLESTLPEKPIARLWATFAGRDRVTSYLRNNVSKLPMAGAQVRGFELHLGQDRKGTQLLRARRGSEGWNVSDGTGPSFPGWSKFCRVGNASRTATLFVEDLNNTINSEGASEWAKQQARDRLPGAEAELAELRALTAELSAARDDHERKVNALRELIKQRVAEFGGNPRAEMIAGARVTGNCAICGRGLTNPVSVERGIGPECFSHIAPDLRAFLDRRHGVAA